MLPGCLILPRASWHRYCFGRTRTTDGEIATRGGSDLSMSTWLVGNRATPLSPGISPLPSTVSGRLWCSINIC